jgi:hypothetical protein
MTVLLDITNVLSLVLAISLLTVGNTATQFGPDMLRKFGAASLSIALFSIFTGLIVYWSVLSGAARRICGWEVAAVRGAEEEDEQDSAV